MIWATITLVRRRGNHILTTTYHGRNIVKCYTVTTNSLIVTIVRCLPAYGNYSRDTIFNIGHMHRVTCMLPCLTIATTVLPHSNLASSPPPTCQHLTWMLPCLTIATTTLRQSKYAMFRVFATLLAAATSDCLTYMLPRLTIVTTWLPLSNYQSFRLIAAFLAITR
jgi:hypothetical protein